MQFSKERKMGPLKESEEDKKKTDIFFKTPYTDRPPFDVYLSLQFILIAVLFMLFYVWRCESKTNNTFFLVKYFILAVCGFVAFRLSPLGRGDDSIDLKPGGSRQEWLGFTRRNIESLSRLERFSLEEYPKDLRLAITRERENFAAYVANPSRSFDTNLSRGEVIYKVLLSFGYLILFLRIRSPSGASSRPTTHEAGYVFDWRLELKELLISVFLVGGYVVVMILGVLLWIQSVNSWGWSWRMGYLARQVRESCLPSDVEKGDGGMRERLIWWIEKLVEEDTDSWEDAEERARKIVAPIVASIKCC
jgi:hypothetical protein